MNKAEGNWRRLRRLWPVAVAVLAACGGASDPADNTANADDTVATTTDMESAQGRRRSSWVYCSAEGATCVVPGTRLVRYGANGTYFYKTVSSSIACNNSTWGDPAVGVGKKRGEYECSRSGACPRAGTSARPRAGTSARTRTHASTGSRAGRQCRAFLEPLDKRRGCWLPRLLRNRVPNLQPTVWRGGLRCRRAAVHRVSSVFRNHLLLCSYRCRFFRDRERVLKRGDQSCSLAQGQCPGIRPGTWQRPPPTRSRNSNDQSKVIS
jgi:hypothetical protein